MYDPERMEYPESYLESTVVHEVAHQWSYGLVGNDQQDEPWLDEALAQYLTLVYYHERYGQGAAAGFRSSFVDRWERVDRADIPIGLPVEAYPGPQYGAIIYGRGPLFLEALAEDMGQAVFGEFLESYYSLHAWGNVGTPEFRRLAETTCSCDLAELFEAWVYEPGR
jgi:aminopeptidase N